MDLHNVFFGGGIFTDGFISWTSLQNGLFYSRQNEKTPDFLGTLLNGLQNIFGFGHRLGLALQTGFDSFLKTTNTSTKLFVVFWGKC